MTRISLFTKLYYLKDEITLKKELFFFNQILNIGRGMFTKNRENPFLDAYLIIANKFTIDLKSCHSLWLSGYYGSAYCLLESLRRSVTMISALYLKPELIVEYLDEDNDQYNKDREFKNKFSEGNIKRIVNEHFNYINYKEVEGKYCDLNKAVHGGAAGARTFYGMIGKNKENKKMALLTYSSFFETEKADGQIEIMKASILDMSGVFLEKYQDNDEIKVLIPKYINFVKKVEKDFLKKQLFQSLKNNL